MIADIKLSPTHRHLADQVHSSRDVLHHTATVAYPPLEDEARPFVTTRQAAHYMQLKEQTLRLWSSTGSGPVRPVRIGGALRWPTFQLRALLGLPSVRSATEPEGKAAAVSAQRNLPHLRRTIACHLGHELTPEIALVIEQAAHHVDDNSIDPAQFEPMAEDGLTFQAERFGDILGDLEAAGLQQGQGSAVESLRFDELQGRLLQFTVRRGPALVGHVGVFVATSRHTGVLMARPDRLQLLPDIDAAVVGLTLMRYAERCLLQIGVRHIEADSKLADGADALLEEIGFTAVATKFSKSFQEAA